MGKGSGRRETAILADPAHEEVYVAWRCAQDLRAAYRAKDTTKGRRRAEKILDAFHTCPIPEVARLGRTLRRWRQAFLAYFDTDRANNGGTEAVNGIIELHRRTREGVAIAKEQGRMTGRKPKLTALQHERILKDYESGEFGAVKLMELYGLSRSAVYAALIRAREQRDGAPTPRATTTRS